MRWDLVVEPGDFVVCYWLIAGSAVRWEGHHMQVTRKYRYVLFAEVHVRSESTNAGVRSKLSYRFVEGRSGPSVRLIDDGCDFRDEIIGMDLRHACASVHACR